MESRCDIKGERIKSFRDDVVFWIRYYLVGDSFFIGIF